MSIPEVRSSDIREGVVGVDFSGRVGVCVNVGLSRLTIEPVQSDTVDGHGSDDSDNPFFDELTPDIISPTLDTVDGLSIYLKELRRYPLLTKEEEVGLVKCIERGKVACSEFSRGSFCVKKSQELRAQIEEGLYASEQLIRSNTRLAVNIAKKHVGHGVPFSDLIQHGNIGLIRALKKFDYRRGNRFSTYASRWIYHEVTRSIADFGRTIRVPVDVHDQIIRMGKQQNILLQKFGREPTVSELASGMEVSEKRVRLLLRASQEALTLDNPVEDEEEGFYVDILEDSSSQTLVEQVEQRLLRENICEIFDAVLSVKHARILKFRYGLFDGNALTLKEIGDKFGVSIEDIRQIEARAFRSLRRNKKAMNMLRGFLDVTP